jgi:murein DD-endopeptidase MepM/ murein hydrolase activator NlpD
MTSTASRKTLIYSPECTVYIATDDGPQKVIDISRDIVRGSVNRVINGASTFSFTLNNKAKKYTGKLSRQDRVVIFLKRVTSVQVFSGYLTTVPAFDLFPTTCTITGHCTIKNLIHTWWDPGLTSSAELLIAANLSAPDAGISRILSDVLVKAGNWNPDAIHIQGVPSSFIDLAKKYMPVTNDAATTAQRLMDLIDVSGLASGTTSNADGSGSGIAAPSATATDPNAIASTTEAQAIYDRSINAFLYALRKVESNNNYKARSSSSTASGAYQFINSTWDNYQGYASAYLAPNAVQNAKAASAVQAKWNRHRNWQRVAASWIYPVRSDKIETWDQPIPNNGTLTIRQYVDRVMQAFSQYTGPTGDPTSAAASSGVNPTSLGETILAPVTGGVITKYQATIPVNLAGWHNDTQHRGVDLKVRSSGKTPVKASLSGKVVFTGASTNGGTWSIWIKNFANGITCVYSGLTSIKVSMQSDIVQGTVVGEVDTTTPSSTVSPYLHFELRKNEVNVDPEKWIGKPVEQLIFEGYTASPDTNGLTPSEQAVYNILYAKPNVQALSSQLTGDRALINDEQLITTIQGLVRSGLRSFQSAPNGDFVAWFPDYFGFFGTKAKFQLEDIEIKDFKIQASDEPMATHVFVSGDNTMAGGIGLDDWLQTGGVVSIEQDFVMSQLLDLSPSDRQKFTAEAIFKRFGARPFKQEFPTIRKKEFEFFLAMQVFMQKWAEQYATSVSLTFMPEIYPGMRIELVDHDLQVYVNSVTHNIDYESGFSTTLQIMAPSSTKKGGGISGLPIGRA